LLVLESSLFGVFTSLDLLLFFIFWEIELVPMYFLISIWGTGRKIYSAWKYVFYTFFGSSFMLVGILVTAFAANTFDMRALAGADLHNALLPTQVLFFFLIIAFAIKLPVFPFHTWLPDAHTDAPTAVSVMLAGVLLKMGGYGMLRVSFTILPDVARDASLWLGAFAVVNILYGAMVTMVQTDLKRLIAYSSISHMGYVLLGISALGTVGLTGAGMQMFTHGVITGLLFIMVGLVYDRTHTRQISDLSGLAHQMPVIAVVMIIAGLASLGLPSLAGFVSEVTVFLGTFGKYGVLTVMAVIGILLTAGYILWMIQRVFYGERNPRWADLRDATAWWERAAMAAMVAVILLVGIYPAVVADVIEKGVQPIAAGLV
jgi:NADH-quinone oxidoreductase subunit M